MNEVWHARSGIVARGRIRSRRRESGHGDVAAIFTTFVSGGVAGLRKSITGHTTQPCGVPEVCVPCELQR